MCSRCREALILRTEALLQAPSGRKTTSSALSCCAFEALEVLEGALGRKEKLLACLTELLQATRKRSVDLTEAHCMTPFVAVAVRRSKELPLPKTLRARRPSRRKGSMRSLRWQGQEITGKGLSSQAAFRSPDFLSQP